MNYFLAFLFFAVLQPAYADFYRDTRPLSILGTGIDGMKITHDLPSDKNLAKLGVREGDIVLEVDNRQITNMQAAREAYNSESLQSVVLIRNNKKILLSKK